MVGRVIVVGSVNVDLVVTRRVACRRPARPSSAAGSRSTTAARAATRPSPRHGWARRTSFVGAVGGRRVRRSRRVPRWSSDGRRHRRRWSPSTGRPPGVAFILVDRRWRERHRRRQRRERRADRRTTSGRRSARLRPVAGDVVLVAHEIPTVTAAEALAAGPRRRRQDDPQPGAGRRPGCGDGRPRRHRDAERGRARRRSEPLGAAPVTTRCSSAWAPPALGSRRRTGRSTCRPCGSARSTPSAPATR